MNIILWYKIPSRNGNQSPMQGMAAAASMKIVNGQGAQLLRLEVRRDLRRLGFGSFLMH